MGPRLAKLDDPSAWRGADLPSKEHFSVTLSAPQVRALEVAVADLVRRGLAPASIQKPDMPLREIAADIEAWRREVLEGRGLLLLRGLPVERWSEAECELAFWGLGLHFGRAVVQSPIGDRLGFVTDASKPGSNERGYRTARELVAHTDSDDIVGMFCLRQAPAGGSSRFISAYTLWNEIVTAHPEFLKPLMRGYHYHWFGEEPPDEPPVSSYRIPVFSLVEGKLSVCYMREFIDWGAKKRRYAFRPIDKAALEHFGALTERPDLRVEFRYEPGDCCFWNNYTMLHARTAYQDDPDPARKRLLLRLWLQVQPRRPVHPAIRRFYGRDGIVIQPERTGTAYAGPAGHNRKGTRLRKPRRFLRRIWRRLAG